MTWKAKSKIGDYNVGDIVPDEQAVVWNGMYKDSPVERVSEDKPQEKVLDVTAEVEEKPKPKAKKKTTKKKKLW